MPVTDTECRLNMRQIGILPECKWVRFYRLQYAVKQTEKNRLRLAQGMKQMGRPTPRLVSIDFTDAWMVLLSFSRMDAQIFADNYTIPYFAVFLDGEYFPLQNNAVPISTIQYCIDRRKIFTLPMEVLCQW